MAASAVVAPQLLLPASTGALGATLLGCGSAVMIQAAALLVHLRVRGVQGWALVNSWRLCSGVGRVWVQRMGLKSLRGKEAVGQCGVGGAVKAQRSGS